MSCLARQNTQVASALAAQHVFHPKIVLIVCHVCAPLLSQQLLGWAQEVSYKAIDDLLLAATWALLHIPHAQTAKL